MIAAQYHIEKHRELEILAFMCHSLQPEKYRHYVPWKGPYPHTRLQCVMTQMTKFQWQMTTGGAMDFGPDP